MLLGAEIDKRTRLEFNEDMCKKRLNCGLQYAQVMMPSNLAAVWSGMRSKRQTEPHQAVECRIFIVR